MITRLLHYIKEKAYGILWTLAILMLLGVLFTISFNIVPFTYSNSAAMIIILVIAGWTACRAEDIKKKNKKNN